MSEAQPHPTFSERRHALDPQDAAAPLAALRVLDLTQVVAGPLLTMMMADLGAEVVKVEPPEGEAYRRTGAPLGPSATVNLMRFGRGKRSVVLDLKTVDDCERLEQLVAWCDVLVENYRAGVLARLGFDWDRVRRLQPRIVYTSITGFGSEDKAENPYSERPAYALIAEAMGGLMHLVGEPDGRPLWLGFAMTDIFSGALAFGSTMLALRRVEETGEAQRAEVSMFDAAVVMNDLAIATYAGTGEVLGRGRYTLQSPWGAYKAQDGYIAIGVFTERQWNALTQLIDRPDLVRENLVGGIARSAVHDHVIAPAVEAWTQMRTRTEIVEALERNGIPGAPVNSAADLVDDPVLRSRGMLVEVEGPGGARTVTPGSAIRLPDTPPPRSNRVADLGADNNEVFAELEVRHG